MKNLQITFLYLAIIFLFSCTNQSNEKELLTNNPDSLFPYPKSELIKEIIIDTARISIGHGDNWAITWADDDKQYSFFTDGMGFGLHEKDVSISPVVIEGNPPNISGKDIPSESGTLDFLEGGSNSAKVSGLIMVNKILYAWVRNLNLEGTPKGTGSYLMYSEDYARTWKKVDWNWPSIGYPTWLNAGQNYSAAKDEFVYMISPDGPSAYLDYQSMLMARVPINKILNKSDYKFYGGMNESEESIWGTYENRSPFFTHEGGSFRPDIVYNPGIDRYILSIASPYGKWWWWADSTTYRTPHLGIFEALNPWGPWSTVYYEKDWGKPEARFSPHIPPKWISDDGKSFYLLYSCIPVGPYRFNIQKCTIVTD